MSPITPAQVLPITRVRTYLLGIHLGAVDVGHGDGFAEEGVVGDGGSVAVIVLSGRRLILARVERVHLGSGVTHGTLPRVLEIGAEPSTRRILRCAQNDDPS